MLLDCEPHAPMLMCAGQAVAPTLLTKHCNQASHSPEISLMEGKREEGAGEWWGRAEAGRICITASLHSYRLAIMSDSSFFLPHKSGHGPHMS